MKNNRMKILSTLLSAFFSIGIFNTAWAESAHDKVKGVIDDAADALKSGLDQIEGNLEDIQVYLNNYPWKGIIQDEAISGAVTLKDLKLNGHFKAVVVRPGDRVNGTVLCNLDPKQSSCLDFYRVLLGFNGKGAQTTIGDEFGILAGESLENFVLIAPSEPGVYQIRFRLVASLSQSMALEAWVDENGNEPAANTTIGIIVVK